MNKQISLSNLEDELSQLPYGFDKGLGFNIAYGAAYLGNDHVRIRFLSHAVNKVLYFVCDMGDYLYAWRQDIRRCLSLFSTFQYTLPVVRL